MLSYIERLRKAPLRERRQVAALVTLVIVGLIAFLWMLSFTFSFFNPFASDDSKKSPTPAQNSGIQGPYQ